MCFLSSFTRISEFSGDGLEFFAVCISELRVDTNVVLSMTRTCERSQISHSTIKLVKNHLYSVYYTVSNILNKKETLHLGFNCIARQLAIRHNTMICFL